MSDPTRATFSASVRRRGTHVPTPLGCETGSSSRSGRATAFENHSYDLGIPKRPEHASVIELLAIHKAVSNAVALERGSHVVTIRKASERFRVSILVLGFGEGHLDNHDRKPMRNTTGKYPGTVWVTRPKRILIGCTPPKTGLEA